MISRAIKILFFFILFSELAFSIAYSQLIIKLNSQFQQLQIKVGTANNLNLQLTQKLAENTSIKSLVASNSANYFKPISNVLNQN